MSAIKKLVIVGGVAGGASAAARARRLDDAVEIIILERGQHVSFANCGLPYHLGGEIAERSALLLHTPASLQARFGLDVRINSEVLGIDAAARSVTVLQRDTGERYVESYDALILAPGAAPIRPALPGLDDARVFTLRNLSDLDGLLTALHAGVQHVTVAGGGFIGLETVEALRHRGLQATLIERGSQVLGPLDPEMAAQLANELELNGVELLLQQALQQVEPGAQLTLYLDSGRTIATDLLILALGVKPETGLASSAGLALGPRGGICVDSQQRSSDPHIFAVGDAVEVRHGVDGQPVLLPLAGPASRQGRIAADVIFGRDAHYRGSQGTAICKVFGLTAASTGLNEKALAASAIRWQKLYLHGNDHAAYYPGATPIHFKLLFSPDSGQLLGAQAVGQKGVDKRIDILAVAIQAGMRVDDLAEMELCYAPPYGSAKDPVNMLGMAAVNVMQGLLRLMQPEELSGSGVQLVDVRELEELASGVIADSLHLPLSQLRGRQLDLLLDRRRPVLVYCAAGMRAYVAQRHLQQLGFDVYSLNGGFASWRLWQQAQQGQGERWPAQITTSAA